MQAMLSMQRKGASSPFEYLGGVAQYDGDGKVNWLVEPPKREDPNATTEVNKRLVRKRDGHVVADFSDPPTPHNVPAGAAAIDPATREVIHNQPPTRAEDWERVTTNGKQYWVRKGEPPEKGILIGPANERQKELTVHELKQIDDAEGDRIQLESTLEGLARAKELNPKIYDGMLGGLREYGATKLTDGLASTFFDPERGKATAEWNSLMRYEAIERMAATLKGATTDTELKEFVKILADSSTAPEVRKSTIERMERLAQKKHDLALKKVEQVRGREFYKPGGGSDTKPAESATPARKPLPEGYTAARVLSEAKEAAKRASPEQLQALREKLESFGISGERL
jgi:hypothetical protein